MKHEDGDAGRANDRLRLTADREPFAGDGRRPGTDALVGGDRATSSRLTNLLGLQRSAGNRAVNIALQRQQHHASASTSSTSSRGGPAAADEHSNDSIEPVLSQITAGIGMIGGLYDNRKEGVRSLLARVTAPEPSNLTDDLMLQIVEFGLSVATSGLGALALDVIATSLRSVHTVPIARGVPAIGAPPVRPPASSMLAAPRQLPHFPALTPLPDLVDAPGGGLAFASRPRGPMPELPTVAVPQATTRNIEVPASEVALSAATHINNAVNSVAPSAGLEVLQAVRRDHGGALTPTLTFIEMQLALIGRLAQTHLAEFEAQKTLFRQAPDGLAQAQATLLSIEAERDAANTQQFEASVAGLLNILSSGTPPPGPSPAWGRTHFDRWRPGLDLTSPGILGLEVDIPNPAGGLAIRSAHLEGVTQEVRDRLAGSSIRIRDFPIRIRVNGTVSEQVMGLVGPLTVPMEFSIERSADGSYMLPPPHTEGSDALGFRQARRRGEQGVLRPTVETYIDAQIEARRIIVDEIGGRTLHSLGVIPA